MSKMNKREQDQKRKGFATQDIDWPNCYDGINLLDDKKDPKETMHFKKGDELPEDLKLSLLAKNPQFVELEPVENILPDQQNERPTRKKELTLSDLPGVGAATAEKLAEAGYASLMAIAVATPGELTEAAGVGEAVARKIINTARNNLEMGFVTGEDLMKRREQVIKITTGSKQFDELIGGGFESGGITETFGQFGSGKTVMAHNLAVNVQLSKEEGGASGSVVWIDTENTFRPERIKQIAEARGMDYKEILKNIHVVRAFNSDHQMLIAEKIEDLITKQNIQVKIVIVDSLMAHFRAEFVGRGTLADRQQKLNKHMHALMKLADMHNLCVYVTNQVMAKPDTFFGDPTAAIGGNIVGHNSTTRIYLRRGKAGTRVAKLVDSPHLPDGECCFNICEKGIEDVK